MNTKTLLKAQAKAKIIRELIKCEEAYDMKLYHYTERRSCQILGMIELVRSIELIDFSDYEELKHRAYTVNTNSVINKR